MLLLRKTCCTRPSTEETILILSALDDLIDDPNFDNTFLLVHFLNKLVQVTESEFGCITRIVHSETGESLIQGHTLTDFAWDETSQNLFMEHVQELTFSPKHPLFERVCSSHESVILEDPSSFLPDGHPFIKRAMSVPIMEKDTLIGIVIVCNKLDHYTKSDSRNVLTILNLSPPLINYELQRCPL